MLRNGHTGRPGRAPVPPGDTRIVSRNLLAQQAPLLRFTHGTRAACLQGGRELGFVRVNVFYVAVNCEWAQVGVCVFVCVCVFVRACFCVCCWSFQQDRARPTRDTSYTRALHSSARINRQSLDLHISPSKQHGGGGCLLGETEWGGGGGEGLESMKMK